MSGRLISLEGGEGAGKSTVMAAIEDWLAARGVTFLRAREPGGTPLGERIRELLLGSRDAMAAQTELLLMFAARAELVEKTIRPALARGDWVLTDRFTDASFAYQGGGRGIDPGFIAELERRVVGLRPDLTLLLDVDVQVGLGRARARGGEPDRIEAEPEAFFQRVRAAYRAGAAAEPQRWRVVDAGQPVERVVEDVQAALGEAWQRWTR
jgi:dTMP kinase